MSGRNPRAGTRPEIALRKLHQAGAGATLHDWMRITLWTGTILRFEQDIIAPLTRCQLVRLQGNTYVMTTSGMALIGVAPDAAALASGQVAGPRYVPEKQPLSARHMVRVSLARPGSFDYAAIPSRMGDQRVPHGLAMPGVMGAIVSE